MKAAAFTIALLLSGTAIAQTNTDADSVSPDTSVSMDTTSTSTTTSMDTMATDTGVTDSATAAESWSNTGSTTMASNMAPAGGQIVEPGNQNPERDARGIRVISLAAVVPAGYNGTMAGNTGMGGPLLDASGQPVSASGDLPACSRTITDRCVQTYERGRR